MAVHVTGVDRRKLIVGGSARRLRPADQAVADAFRFLIPVIFAILGLVILVGMGTGMAADALPAGGPAPGWP
jgi:hypothetical protein